MRDREQKWHVYDYYVLLIKQVRCKSLVGTCLPNMKNPTRLSLLCDFCGRLVEARCLKVAGNGESPEDVQSRISGESSQRGRRGPQPKQRYRANTPGRDSQRVPGSTNGCYWHKQNIAIPCTSSERTASCYFAGVVAKFMHEDDSHIKSSDICR